MKNRLLIASTLLLILSCVYKLAFASETDEYTSIGSIRYIVMVPSSPAQQISVDMRIFRSKETQDNAYSGALFYHDNVNLTEIKVFTDAGTEVPYFNRGGGIMITLPKNYADIKYTVKLSELSKHGHQGIQTAHNVLFAGEQVFMVPFREKMKEMSIEFKIPEGWNVFAGGIKNNKIVKKNTEWFDIYSILKNCYAFGNFKKQSYKNKNGKLNIWYPGTELTPENIGIISNNSYKMFNYFTNLFGKAIKRYDIFILSSAQDGKKVFCGSGDSSMASTVIFNDSRDWQLMAHRMAHSFFDNFIKYKKVHAPPNLWLLEAITTYYENAAMGNGDYTEFTSQEGFAELYRRYIFLRTTNPEFSSIKPIDDEQLLSSAENEFLHYTQAPLLLLAMEDHINKLKDTKNGNYLLKWCIENSKNTVLIDNMLDSFNIYMGGALDGFIEDYVKNNRFVVLWDHFKNIKENPGKIAEQFAYFDDVLSSWYRVSNQTYEKHDFTLEGIEDIIMKAENEKVVIPDAMLAAGLKDFSPTVYKLLIKHFYSKKAIKDIEIKDIKVKSIKK